jgi:MFS family permease
MGRLLIVMLGAFVAQTAEYLPIGLLPEISRNLQVSESAVGALLTGYAWLAAATAVPLTLATNRLSRRGLFLGLIGVVSLANILAALSPNYAVLTLMRAVTALTHGVFWSILASFATRTAPEMPAGRPWPGRSEVSPWRSSRAFLPRQLSANGPVGAPPLALSLCSVSRSSHWASGGYPCSRPKRRIPA